MRKFNICSMIVICTIVASSCFGEVVLFRSGKVLSADMSTKAVSVANFDLKTVTFPKKYYAQIVCTVSPSRILSRFDYSIQAFGVDFPCVAITRGGSPYDRNNVEYGKIKPNEKFAMLFILDGSVVGLNDIEKLKLKCSSKDDYPLTDVPFVNLKSAALPRVDSVPVDGNFPSNE